jgi:hypothetical protein
MRGEHSKENLFRVAEIDKFHHEVAGVAIKDEDAPSLPRLLLCGPLKHLFKPHQTQVIIASSRR